MHREENAYIKQRQTIVQSITLQSINNRSSRADKVRKVHEQLPQQPQEAERNYCTDFIYFISEFTNPSYKILGNIISIIIAGISYIKKDNRNCKEMIIFKLA